MAKLSLPSIDSETTECTILNCDGIWTTVENPWATVEVYLEENELPFKIEDMEDCMDEDAKQASIPYTYNAPQHDWKCGYSVSYLHPDSITKSDTHL